MEYSDSQDIANTGTLENVNADEKPEQSSSNNADVSMEFFFASPLFWKSEKICRFFAAAHTYAWERTHVKAFKKALNKGVADFPFWGSADKWEDALTPEHFRIITSNHTKQTQQNNAKSGKTSTIVDLLRRIRDNFIHHQKISPEDKRALGWFREKAADLTVTSSNSSKSPPTFELDQGLFVKYWISQYPNLLPYLWLHFKAFEDASLLKEFYPIDIPNYSDDLFRKLVNFSVHLNGEQGALAAQLGKGSVITRYSIGGRPTDTTIEYRMLERNILHKLLDTSSLVNIEIRRDQVICEWFDEKSDEFPVDSISSVGNSYSNEPTLFFLADNMQYICENRVLEYLKILNREDVKATIIIYINKNQNDLKNREEMTRIAKNMAQSVSREIVELPVKFTELTNEIQLQITEKGKFVIHSRAIPFTNLLSDDITTRKDILSNLQGDVLNYLLRNESPKLFEKLEQPCVARPYFVRKISQRVEILPARVLEQRDSDNHVLVFTNLSWYRLKTFLKYIGRSEPHIEGSQLNQCFKKVGNYLFWGGADIHDDNVHLEAFLLETFHDRKAHCLQYLHGDKFELLATNSYDSNLETFLDKDLSKIRELPEKTFLEKLNKNLEQMIFLADEPGMGKSTVFISLANELELANSLCFCFILNMTIFTKQFTQCQTDSTNDLEQFCNALFSSLCINEFECSLLKYWLSDKNRDTVHDSVRLEIMLDGLDEVEVEDKKKAISILEIFHENKVKFPFVRLWVSFRDHMLQDIDDKFNTLGFKMKQFNESEQARFLIEYWKSKSSHKNVNFDSDEVIAFTKSCLKLPMSKGDKKIASTPLICRMIAEIYEDIDFSGKLEIVSYHKKFGLTDLYSDLMDKKIERAFKEKDQFTSITREMSHFKEKRDFLNRSHAYYAIKLIHTDALAAKFKDRLCVTSLGKKDFEFSVLRPGAIDNLDPLRFKHRTFAEYFLALFVYNVFIGKLSIKAEDLDFDELMTKTFECDQGNDRKFKHPIVCQILDSMAKHNNKGWDKFQPYFDTRSERCSILIEGSLASNHFKKYLNIFEYDGLNLLNDLVEHFHLLQLVSYSTKYNHQVFVCALLSGEYTFCRDVLENQLLSVADLTKLTHYNSVHKFGLFKLIILGLTVGELFYFPAHKSAGMKLLKFLKDKSQDNNISLNKMDTHTCDDLQFLLENFNCIKWTCEDLGCGKYGKNICRNIRKRLISRRLRMGRALIYMFLYGFHANVEGESYADDKLIEYSKRKCEDETCICRMSEFDWFRTRMFQDICQIIYKKRKETNEK